MIFLLRELKKRCIKDGIFDLSAQLAYYFLMSFFPFLLLSVTLLGYLPFNSKDLLILLQPFTPADSFQLIKNHLIYLLDEQRGDLLSISAISTTYLASLAFHSIIRILNFAYGVRQSRPFWKNIFLGTFLMLGIFLALIISLLFPIFGKIVGEFIFRFFNLSKWYSTFWDGIRWVVSSVILMLIFLFIYRFIPNIRLTFAESLPGALFATFGWQFSSLAFSLYVNLDHYSLIYGNLGGIIILVGWFYLTAFILVMGGQVNAIWRKRVLTS